MPKPLRLIIKPDARHTAEIYHAVMMNHINYKQDVPYDLVKAFLAIIIDEEYEKEILSEGESVRLVQELLTKLKNQKQYDFKWISETRVIDGKETVVKNDSVFIFSRCIVAFWRYEKEREKTEKDNAIYFFYRLLSEWAINKLIKKYRKEFTQYRMQVLAGLLAQLVGYRICNKKDPTNEEIFQATKNAIKRKKH